MNIFDIKHNNRKLIYFYLRENKTATRQDIAYKLRLSLPTVTQNLEQLIEQGLISSEKKVSNKSGGRNPLAYKYVSDAKVAIGLDITRNHIKSIIVDLDGNVIKYIYRRKAYHRNDDYLKMLGQEVENIINSAHVDRDKILGVGIAVPGLIDHQKELVVDGRVIDNQGMRRQDFAKYIPFPTKLIHDSDASGFSEIWTSTDVKDAFYISLCNSVGGSIFIDDKVFLGQGLFSGEIGHLNIIPEGRSCYCGRKGCLDPYCNAEVLSSYTGGDLHLFFEKLESGDEDLAKVWDEYLDHLAFAINDIRMLFGCTIIIGGYVGSYMKEYMDRLHEIIDSRSPFGEKSQNFVIPCRNKIESVATGSALYFVQDFINTALIGK